jgi:hypothetical protein
MVSYGHLAMETTNRVPVSDLTEPWGIEHDRCLSTFQSRSAEFSSCDEAPSPCPCRCHGALLMLRAGTA